MLFRGKNAADLENWEMTKEQINIAIAESLGWSIFYRNDKGEIKSWKHPDGSIWQEPWVPLRFIEDLNAMHEVEKSITDPRKMLDYFNHLSRYNDPDARSIQDSFNIITATAAQRAEAYLRTIGKWKDE